MALPTAFGLLLFTALLTLVGWWLSGREPESARAVRAWAQAAKLRLRDSAHAVEVIGAREGRLFTVSVHAGPPAVLLIAVDCDAEAIGLREAGTLHDRALDDSALVSRWTNPTAEHLAGLDGLVDAMVQAAADLEAADLEAADPGNGVTTRPAPE